MDPKFTICWTIFWQLFGPALGENWLKKGTENGTTFGTSRCRISEIQMKRKWKINGSGIFQKEGRDAAQEGTEPYSPILFKLGFRDIWTCMNIWGSATGQMWTLERKNLEGERWRHWGILGFLSQIL